MSQWAPQYEYAYDSGDAHADYPGARRPTTGAASLAVAGLGIGIAAMPALFILARSTHTVGFAGIVVFLSPLIMAPLLMLGFRNAAYSLMLVMVAVTLAWRTTGRFTMFPEVLGIQASPENIALLLVFLQSFLWRKCRSIPGPLWAFIVLGIAGALVGAFAAEKSGEVLSIMFLRMIIPVTICANAIRSIATRRDLELALKGVLLVLAAGIIYNMWFGLSAKRFHRLQMGGNVFAMMCLYMLPVAFVWALRHPRTLMKALGIVLALVLLLQIWMASSRTSIVLAGGFLLIFALVRFRAILLRPHVVITFIVLGALAMGYLGMSAVYTTRKTTQLSRFRSVWELGFVAGSGRKEVWTRATAILGEHPVAGIGMDKFQIESVNYAHAHNVFLAIWLDVGLLGLIGFVILVGYTCISSFRWSCRAPPGISRDTGFAMLAMMMLTITSLQVEGYIYSGTTVMGSFAFHLVIALVLITVKVQGEEEQQRLYLEAEQGAALPQQ